MKGNAMSSTPLYQDIYRDLQMKILSGYYSEKTYLPSERSLCEMYHVSRATIRRALEELYRDKYIEKKQGSGNFVKPQMYEQTLSKFYSFVGSLRAQHIEITNQIIDCDIIAEDRYLAEAVPPKEDCRLWHKLIRLRSANDYPLMLETTYLPKDRFARLDPEYLKSGSLYHYLESYYSMEIDNANELLSPIMPSPREARYLQISTQDPCMLLERFCYENERLIAIHKTIVRGDKYKFRAFYYTNA